MVTFILLISLLLFFWATTFVLAFVSYKHSFKKETEGQSFLFFLATVLSLVISVVVTIATVEVGNQIDNHQEKIHITWPWEKK